MIFQMIIRNFHISRRKNGCEKKNSYFVLRLLILIQLIPIYEVNVMLYVLPEFTCWLLPLNLKSIYWRIL